MIEFKRQTERSTRMDRTRNINIFLKDFEFGVVSSNHWGVFDEIDSVNPLIQLSVNGFSYQLRLSDLRDLLDTASNRDKLRQLNEKIEKERELK